MRNAASRRDAIPRIEVIGEGGKPHASGREARLGREAARRDCKRFGPGRYPATDATVQIPLSAAEYIYLGVLRYGFAADVESAGASGATGSRCGLRRYPGGRVALRAGRCAFLGRGRERR